MTVPDLLQRLLAAAGPPGHERAPAAVWREAAESFADEVTVDALGTSVARVAARGDGPLLAVVGHIDEIGLLVSHVDDKGFLRVVGSGGWDPQVLVGQRVEVIGRERPVPGVVGRKPIHLLEQEERKQAVKLKQLYVDIGVRNSEEARALVAERDPVVIDAEPVELPNGRPTTAWACTSRSRWLVGCTRQVAAPAPWPRSPRCRRRSARTGRARWCMGSSRTWRWSST